MHVQARACVILVGFGHERRGKTVFAGHAAHQHLEQPRIIRSLQGVWLVHHVDFELAQTGLGNRGVCGNVHQVAGVVKLGKELVELVQRPQAEDLAGNTAFARAWRYRHPQVTARIVDQEELKLDRDHGRQPQIGKPLLHGGQCMARIALKGAAILVEHPDRHQPCGRVQPWHPHEPAVGGFQHAVAVAAFHHQRAVVDVFAPDIKVHH